MRMELFERCDPADEATVKRVRRVDGRIRLDPENDHLEPFFPDHVVVMGVVVGVFRRI